jgi:hypothetical protein
MYLVLTRMNAPSFEILVERSTLIVEGSIVVILVDGSTFRVDNALLLVLKMHRRVVRTFIVLTRVDRSFILDYLSGLRELRCAW